MIRFLLRRLLAMVLTFIGITLVGFVVISAAGRPLAATLEGGGAGLPRRAMTEEEIATLRQELALDLPLFFNRDVQDHPAAVARRVQEIAGSWAALEESLAQVVDGLEPRPRRTEQTWTETLLPALVTAATDAAAVVERPERWLDDPPPGITNETWSAWRGRLRERLAPALQRIALASRRTVSLGRRGAWTMAALAAPWGAVATEGPARLALRNAGSAAARELLADSTAAAAWWRAHADDFSPASLEARAAEWLGHCEQQVAAEATWNRARIAAAKTRSGSPERAAAARAEASARQALAAATVERERCESEAAPAGALLLPAFLPRLLAASPFVRARGVKWLREVADFSGRFAVPRQPHESLSDYERERLAVQTQELRATWRRVRLETRSLGALERWGLCAWTETRYARWLGRLVRGDLGVSLHHERAVATLLRERLGPTLFLQITSLFLIYLAAIPLGVWSARRAGRPSERAVSATLFAIYGLPSFFIGTVLLWLLASPDHLEWFPLFGLRDPRLADQIREGRLSMWSWTALSDLAWHAVLPVLTLTLGSIAALSRYAREGLRQVFAQDFIRALRARGLGEGAIVWKHGLRNGLLPLVAILPAVLPALVGGSIIVESIFGIPGMGLLTLRAAETSDLPVAMGGLTLVALLTMVGYLLADVAAAALDPRLRRRARG